MWLSIYWVACIKYNVRKTLHWEQYPLCFSVVKDLSCVQSVRGHQISKLQERPLITRPHTARAALQKHHQHHSLKPCRGSSQPDWRQCRMSVSSLSKQKKLVAIAYVQDDDSSSNSLLTSFSQCSVAWCMF